MTETTGAATARGQLRHALATLAYRARKPLADPPASFPTFRAGEGIRTPVEIVAHLADLMAWALTQARGEERWMAGPPASWEEEVARFWAGAAALDAHLASEAPLGQPEGRIFQGALADALTHVGQLALLRRMAGSPIRGENYNRAEIVAGRVGPGQAAPRREFD